MTSDQSVAHFLAECESESGRYSWEGTFADYLAMVFKKPTLSRLSHKLVYDAILSQGVEETASGEMIYGLFEGEIYGLNEALSRIVQYFASAADRLSRIRSAR